MTETGIGTGRTATETATGLAEAVVERAMATTGSLKAGETVIDADILAAAHDLVRGAARDPPDVVVPGVRVPVRALVPGRVVETGSLLIPLPVLWVVR